MAVSLSLRSRELGLNNPCSLGVERSRARSSNRFSWDFMLEKFTCRINDEHYVMSNDEVSEWAIEVPPFAVQFSSVPGNEHILALANEEGDIEFINTNLLGGDVSVQRIQAHANAVFDFKWLGKESKLVTASGDMTAAVFDVSTSQKLAHFRGHNGSVKSVDVLPGCQFNFATGSRDGSIMTWDTRCSHRGQYHHPINTLHKVHEMDITFRQPNSVKSRTKTTVFDAVQSVTNVLFQDGAHLFSSGATDGVIKVWDLRKTYTTYKRDPMPKHSFLIPDRNIKKHGCSNMIFDSSRKRLYASCTNNLICQYNCSAFASENPDARFFGQTVGSFYVRLALSPDDQYLLSGSSDTNAYIWKVNGDGKPFLQLKGHMAETTAVAWCPNDMFKIITCSDDLKFRIWRASNDEIHSSCIRDAAEVAKEFDIASKDILATTPLANKDKESTPSAKKVTSPSVLNWLQKSSPASRNDNLQITPTSSKGIKRKTSNAITQASEDGRTPFSPRKENNFGSRQLPGRALNFSDEFLRQEKSDSSKENVDVHEDMNAKRVRVDNGNANLEILQREDLVPSVRLLQEEASTDGHKASPTFALPNLVVDEPTTAQCPVSNENICNSRQKKLDWLTNYSKQCKKNSGSTRQPKKKSQRCVKATVTTPE